jgi:chromosome segregation ATPase
MDGQVGNILQGVLAVAEGLKTRVDEIETNLEQALAEARRLLQEGLTADLERFQDEIKQKADEVAATINECPTELQAKYDEFSEHLKEVESLLEDEAFGRAPDHAREVVEEALKQCAQEHREELEQVVAAAATLESTIGELDQEVDETKSETVESGKEDLLEKMSETSDGLGEAQQALSEVKALLARFAFVRM